MKAISCVLFFGVFCLSIQSSFCVKNKQKEVTTQDFLNFVENNDIKKAKDYLVLYQDSLQAADAQDKNGLSALHLATTKVMVEMLLDRGADVRLTDEQGRTPLHYARNNAIARALIEVGADINARDNFGRTPLFYARTVVIAQRLIAARADVNVVSNSHESIFEYLLNRLKQDLQSIADESECGLVNEVYNGMLLLLLQHNALITEDSSYARLEDVVRDLIHDDFITACITGNADWVRGLIEADKHSVAVDRSHQDEEASPLVERPVLGITPLMAAVAQGQRDIIYLLLDHGAEVTQSHVDVATRNGFSEIAQFLSIYMSAPRIVIQNVSTTDALQTPDDYVVVNGTRSDLEPQTASLTGELVMLHLSAASPSVSKAK